MSDEAYDVALGVLRGFTMGEEVGSQALAVVESQNQALQEENERLHKAYGRLVERLRLATPRSLMEVSDEALSPTQETDPKAPWSQPIGYEGTATLDATQETDPE